MKTYVFRPCSMRFKFCGLPSNRLLERCIKVFKSYCDCYYRI